MFRYSVKQNKSHTVLCVKFVYSNKIKKNWFMILCKTIKKGPVGMHWKAASKISRKEILQNNNKMKADFSAIVGSIVLFCFWWTRMGPKSKGLCPLPWVILYLLCYAIFSTEFFLFPPIHALFFLQLACGVWNTYKYQLII